MKLTKKQKQNYIDWFEDEEDIEYLNSQINKKWEIKHQPNPNDFPWELFINNQSYDTITDYGLSLIK